jgi:hypothetical protein
MGLPTGATPLRRHVWLAAKPTERSAQWANLAT